MVADNREDLRDWIERVKALMPGKGIHTYQDLAYHSGVSSGSLNQAMRGLHMPRQKTIEKIATALDTTPQYLLYGDTMRVIHRIPFLDTAEKLCQWFSGKNLEMESLDWIDSPGHLTLSKNAFAIGYNHHDLEPMFLPGDIIIFERVNDGPNRWGAEKDTFVLALRQYSFNHKKSTNWLFGRYVLTNNGRFLEPLDKQYNPVLLDDNCTPIGVAVYQMRMLKSVMD
ncbi:helix-turn-helix domain-containing protein [Endozoicomonas sp. 2B-B]